MNAQGRSYYCSSLVQCGDTWECGDRLGIASKETAAVVYVMIDTGACQRALNFEAKETGLIHRWKMASLSSHAFFPLLLDGLAVHGTLFDMYSAWSSGEFAPGQPCYNVYSGLIVIDQFEAIQVAAFCDEWKERSR